MTTRIELRRLKRGLTAVLVGVGGLLVLAVGGVLVVSNTDWGREQVRTRVLSMLNEQMDGAFRIGAVDGNLLTGMKLVDVAIDAPSGAPFLRADTLQTDFDLLGLVRQRILLNDMRLVNPVVVLDRRPGERWNYEQIFLSDTTTQDTIDTGPGFGSWIRIEDLEIAGGRVIVRLPWSPDSALTGAARDSAVRVALAEDSRTRVEAVPGGYQTIYDFQELSAALPLLNIADPDFDAQQYEFTRLTTVAYPFRPPPVRIKGFAGTLQISGDSLWFENATVQLPGTRAGVAFSYNFTSGVVATRVAADTVALADLQFAYLPLPDSGGGRLTLDARITDDSTIILARNTSLAIGRSRIAGELGLTLTDSATVFRNTDLTLASFDTRLIEQVVPDLELPRNGVVDGRARVDGALNRMTVDADLAFDDPGSGTSRVLATGIAGITESGAFLAENLQLELRPLQVALAEIASPDLPVDGTVTGSATLNGSTAGTLRTRFDLAHASRGERSRIAGTADVRLEPSLVLDVDARLAPLSLATVGRFAPGAGLRGTVSGPVRLRGPLNDLAINARLTTPDGGVLAAVGRADLQEPGRQYALRLAAEQFNPGAIRTAGPPGGLNFVARATGRGFDPATLQAVFELDMGPSRLDTLSIDSAQVRAVAASGLARIDTLTVWAPSTQLAAIGTLGLVAGREGELAYRLSVDSLSQFASYLPPDTGVVAPRPAVVQQAVAAARADSVARAEVIDIERMARGTGPTEPMPPVEEPPSIARDSLGGSVYAAGTARGNITELDVVGRLAAFNVVAMGNTIGQLRAEYRWIGGLTPDAFMLARVSADEVLASGFALDSIEAVATYAGTAGTVELRLRQDDQRDYEIAAGFRLDVDDRAVLLNRMALRFDTTTWRSVRPSEIRLGANAIVVDSLELRDGRTGRIFADGTLPLEGAGRFDVSIRELPIGQLAALVQTDLGAGGLLSLDARLEGTASAPEIRGALAVANAGFGGPPLLDFRGTFNYADQRLAAEIEGLHTATSPARGGRALLADLTVPVNLAIATDAPRLPEGPGDTLAVAVRVDSLPLNFVAAFVPEILRNVAGVAVGEITVTGPMSAPRASGTVAIVDGDAQIVPLGIRLRDVVANIRLDGDVITVDSLVGYNRGRVLVRGDIGIDSIAAPSFDLYLVADGAEILNNEIGTIRVDAGLALRGPFDAVYASGGVRIREGVFYIPEGSGGNVISADNPALFAVADEATLAEGEIIAPQSPLLANLRANVELVINRGTWVRSRDANVEIFTPDDTPPVTISVDQARQQLVLDGIVSTDRGEYTFLGKRFELREGSALFVGIPEINPTLQLIGEYAVQLPASEAIIIRILIGGTLLDPRIELQSGEGQPQLSQSDLISYLALGRGSSSLFQGGGSSVTGGGGGGAGGLVGRQAEQVARRLPAFAINTLFNDVLLRQLEGSAGRRLGADVLNITPADLPIEATGQDANFETFLIGTEVEVGRYLTPRTFLSVTARPSLFFTPEGVPRTQPGIRFQFRPRPGFQLEATLEPRFLLREPTLESVEVNRFEPRGALGLFITREWRW